MVHENPWYLITDNEIAHIRGNLQDIRHEVPQEQQELISSVLDLLHNVQVRRP
ncbi:MAG: hypothetical protein GYA23_05945 [Methanomicrobiales archaeon]|nr:hypothetical protein [Methanomicrobiales archaeon]